MSQVSTMTEDGEWLLAAALLDSLADDLAITLAAGWWRHEPGEMAGKCYEADALLAEMASERVEGLHDLIRAATSGQIQTGPGWLRRLARHRAAMMRRNRSLSFAVVQAALKLPNITRSERLTDMPPVRLPDGRFNPEYQRERARRLKVRGLCRDCKAEMPPCHGGTRCPGCRADHARRVRELEGFHVTPPPAGAQPFKQWLKAQAARLLRSEKTVRWYLKRGLLAWPPLYKMSQRQWWVLPEGRAA